MILARLKLVFLDSRLDIRYTRTLLHGYIADDDRLHGHTGLVRGDVLLT